MKPIPFLLLSILLLSACRQQLSKSNTSSAAITGEQDAEAGTGNWVTYSGILPCGDCTGIETTLTLHEQQDNTDFRYRLRETYTGLKSGKDVTINSEGSYTIVSGAAGPGDTVILLNPEKDRVLQRSFRRTGQDALVMMNRDDKPVQSALNYTLRKQ